MAKKIIDAQNAFENTENINQDAKVVEEVKPKKTRKRSTKKVNESEISETPTPMSEDAINKPEKMTLHELVVVLDDFVGEGADRTNAIRDYLVENNLVNKYVKIEDVVNAAAAIFRRTCFDDNGEYHKDSNLIEIYSTVINTSLRLNVEIGDYTFFDAYDVIKKYQLDDAVYICDHYYSQIDIEDAVYNIVDDYKENERSVSVYAKKVSDAILDFINSMTDSAENPSPELVKLISDNLATSINNEFINK